jgi:hydroxysqualene synthase
MSVLAIDTAAAVAGPGKGHRDENFPVASRLLAPRHRAPIMAFYRFARAADDIADDPQATPADKSQRLAAMRATLAGEAGSDAGSDEHALALRVICGERGLDVRHGLDLLRAFERDVAVDRCADWPALIDYCRVSAMPVGRFVLDVHGQHRETWPASDALCAALQIINHVQDCAKDWRTLHRVYLPLDLLAQHGATVADLARPAATPGLRAAIVAAATRARALLADAAGFAGAITDRRLAAEVAVIHRLADDLAQRLQRCDPLCQRVHHTGREALLLALPAAARALLAGRRTVQR